MTQQYLFTYHKSSIHELRVSRVENKGEIYLDIREFYLNDDDDWRPTKKGIRFKIDHEDTAGMIDVITSLCNTTS